MADSFPLFSCLCVTEKRSAFMPWLLWNFEKQSWPNKELVVIDSSPEAMLDARANVRIVRVDPGATVPEKRNRALAEAHGEWVAWFDDDDWQHPERLRRLAGELDEGVEIAGPSCTALLDLKTCGVQRYEESDGLVFNGVGLAASAARSRSFDLEPVRGSETIWLKALCATFDGRVREIGPPLLGLLLCHHANLNNSSQRWRVKGPLESLITEIGLQSWADTDEQLDELRVRIDEERAREFLPPVAVADPDALKRKPYRLYG